MKDDSNLPPSNSPAAQRRGWIGVDLDGTLAHFDGKYDPAVIGAPIAPMLARVRQMIETGWTVKIMTARAADLSNHAVIHAWLLEHGLPILEVTDRKDFDMVWLWDDRAIAVATNTGISHHDDRRLMRQDLLTVARAVGAELDGRESFHVVALKVFSALNDIYSKADVALDMLTHVAADRFKGGDGSQGFKDVGMAKRALRDVLKRIHEARPQVPGVVVEMPAPEAKPTIGDEPAEGGPHAR